MTGRVVAKRALLAAFLSAFGARAQASSFDMPAECGTEGEFRQELVRLVGADADRAQPSVVAVTRSGDAEYRLTLELGGERRELTHADCRVLFRSALVIAAASVRPPEAPPAEPETAPAVSRPPATPIETKETVPTAESEVAEPSDAGPPVRGNLSGGAGLAVGIVPGPTAVLELRAGAMVGNFGLSLSGKFMPARYVASEGRGADIRAFGLRAALGMRPVESLWVSAGFDADLLIGKGDPGITDPGEDSAWTLAPSLELAVIPINTSHLALEIALQGRVAVQRPVFEVTGFREIYQVPPIGMLSVARGVWHFP
jgi:hypothetical protein